MGTTQATARYVFLIPNHRLPPITNYIIQLAERRRRDAVDQSFNELARIVPGCGATKESILEHTVQYIKQLKEAIDRLKVEHDRLKEELEKAKHV